MYVSGILFNCGAEFIRFPDSTRCPIRGHMRHFVIAVLERDPNILWLDRMWTLYCKLSLVHLRTALNESSDWLYNHSAQRYVPPSSYLICELILFLGPQESSVGQIREFEKLFLAPGFVTYASVLIVASLVIIFYFAPRYLLAQGICTSLLIAHIGMVRRVCSGTFQSAV